MPYQNSKFFKTLDIVVIVVGHRNLILKFGQHWVNNDKSCIVVVVVVVIVAVIVVVIVVIVVAVVVIVVTM